MRWIPGGTFAMGSEDFYPEERPVHRVSVDGFWMDETPVTAAQFRRFVSETKYMTLAERPARCCALSRRRSRAPRAGLARVPEEHGPGRPERPPQLVGVRAGRVLEATGREGNDDQRPRHVIPVVHIAYEDAEAYAAWAGKELAERSRVGVRRTRRARRCGVRVGRRALPGRQGDGELLAGRVPLAEPEARRLRGNVAGRQLSAERLRALRRDRERLGVDIRLVHVASSGRGREPVLRSAQPADHLTARHRPERRSRDA